MPSHFTTVLRLLHRKRVLICNLACIAVFLALPYYLFRGQLFIGGDDSRLLYSLPKQFLQQVALTPWLHFSTPGSYTPNYFLIPLLLVLWGVQLLVHSQIVVAYAAFSAPLILGFVYFRKMMLLLISEAPKRELEVTIGALMYVLSPIVIVGQLAIFLYSAWLIGLLPLLTYYFISYQRTGSMRNVIVCALWSFPLAQAFFSIPWLLGLLLPASLGLIVFVSLQGRRAVVFVRRAAFFFAVLAAAQAFWVIPLVTSFGSGYAGNAVNNETGDTFSPTVLATAHGNILYPLLDLYHRQIAFDFNWSLKQTFLQYYDKVLFLDLLTLAVLIAGITVARKHLRSRERSYHLAVLVAFVAATFLFTVNIGVFKQLFLYAGHTIPGFAMFRNFSDKFALGFAFLYATLFVFSLVALARYVSTALRYLLLAGVTLLILLNAAPIRSIIVKPLWTTKNIQTMTTLPQEYLGFMKQVTAAVPATTNILSIPFGSSVYTIIPNAKSGSVYAGRSPVQLLSGVNDISGNLSFSPAQAEYVTSLIKGRYYERLRVFMQVNNINYVLATRNLPAEVRGSYLFEREVLEAQDKQFEAAITDGQVALSNRGNYVLFKAKSPGSLFTATDKMINVAGGRNQQTTNIQDLQLASDEVGHSKTLVPGSLAGYSSSVAYPLASNKEFNLPAAGNYTVKSNHPNVGTLSYDSETRELRVDSGLAYQLGTVSHAQNRSVLAKVSPSALVKVGEDITQVKQAAGIAIRGGGTITVYESSGKNMLPAPKEMVTAWHPSDCNSYEPGKVATSVKSTSDKKGDQLVLSANRNHNACVHATLPATAKSGYLLSFDYQTTASKLITSYDGKEISLSAGTGVPGTWQHFDYTIAKKAAGQQVLYLYSGTNRISATTYYKNVLLLPYSDSKPLPLTVPNINPPTLSGNAHTPFRLRPDISDDTHKLGDVAKWNRADCSAIDAASNPVEFSFARQEFTLRSQRGHNACINNFVPVDSDNTYILEFDYRALATQELITAVSMQNRPEITAYKLSANTPGQWQHFRQEISLPRDVNLLRIYLYSGHSDTSIAATTYKAVKLTSEPLNYKDAYLVLNRAADSTAVPARSKFSRRSSIAHTAEFTGVAKPFLLTFADSFHPGWKLYLRPLQDNKTADRSIRMGVTRPLFDESHVQINGFANGWLIDPAFVKAHYGHDYYHENPDGSIDFNMAVYFKPQSYFYIGLLVSGLTLGGCLLALGVLAARDRRRGKQQRQQDHYRVRPRS